MTTKNSLPVRYVLYSHYPEGDDLKHYPEKKPCELDGVKDLIRHLKRLQGLLTWPVSKDCSSYFTRPVLPSV